MRFDVMLESYVWNSTATRHEIDALARKYLGVDHDALRRPDRTRRETDRLQSGRRRSRDPIRRRAGRPGATAACEPVAEGGQRADAAHALRCDRTAARARVAADGASRRADRRRSAAGAKQSTGGAHSRARSTGPRGGGRAVCTGIAETAPGSAVRQTRAAGASARRRPVSPRRRKTCWRSLRRNTSCRA